MMYTEGGGGRKVQTVLQTRKFAGRLVLRRPMPKKKRNSLPRLIGIGRHGIQPFTNGDFPAGRCIPPVG